MKNLKNLGIYLNEEPGDDEALAFASLLIRRLRPESIYCINVRGIEDPVTTPPPELESIRGKILEALPADSAGNVSVHVYQGTGMLEMLRTARDHDLDLVVVGRRLPSDQLGVGSAFYRLARKSPCDVLVVPDGCYAHLSRLLVLSDGSEHSKLALEAALHLSRISGERPQVIVQCVYDVPGGYGYSGKTCEEAAGQRQEQARKRIEESLAGVDSSGVDFQVVYTCSQDIAGMAHSLAAAKNMDAIVIGSRGATLPATFLLGATTERVLLNAPVPVLVVKRKGETFGFLDALLAQFREA